MILGAEEVSNDMKKDRSPHLPNPDHDLLLKMPDLVFGFEVERLIPDESRLYRYMFDQTFNRW